MTTRAVPLILICAAAASAQEPPVAQSDRVIQSQRERVVQVTGTGMVETPPDVANLAFWLRGEGATPDDATRALQAKQRAVTEGLAALLGRDARITTAEVTVIETRGPGCQDRGYNAQPRLSEGECAVKGYLATMQGAVRTGATDKAATAAGLASRLGASDARVQGFDLSTRTAATARATAAAFADARARAEALARGAGLRLGPVTLLRDGNYQQVDRIVANDIGAMPVTGVSLANARSAVALDTRPRPVETRAQVYVSYTLLP